MQVEQNIEDAREDFDLMFDICKRVNACVPSFMCVHTSSCGVLRSIKVLETDTRYRTLTSTMAVSMPTT